MRIPGVQSQHQRGRSAYCWLPAGSEPRLAGSWYGMAHLWDLVGMGHVAALEVSSASAARACCGTTPLPSRWSDCRRVNSGVSVTQPTGSPINHSSNRGFRTLRPVLLMTVGWGAVVPVIRSHRLMAGQ